MSLGDRNLNLPEREEKILEFWEREKIFEKTLAATKKGKPFVFYEGPPTANGNPGIHHFEARAFKDLIPRYKTMRGFYVERKAGWDTHGLPVEIQVEKALGLKSKRDIETYGIAKFNAACKESVWKYKTEWDRFTKRIGYWLDLEHPYITYETSYIETLWWVIKEFGKKKLFYQDFKVVPWCTRCGTALSTHELGLNYKTVKDRSVYTRFRVKAKGKEWQNTSILSWTTTPWTLPGNVALAVNPKEEYARIPDPDHAGQWIIVAEKRVAEFQKSNSTEAETFPGKDLIGLAYEPLFSVRELESEKAHRIYAADFVTMEEGTGVVHTAVMYGEDDYKLGKAIGLPTFHTVDEMGRFIPEVPEGLGGLYTKDPKTEEKIIASLSQRGLLFREQLYEHEYPFCWRCETPILYYARNAWWVKMSAVKKDLVQNNEKINWVPEHIKRGRFGEFLREVRDWAFSRERYWGTPLPIWQCEKCKHQEVIGSLDELTQRASSSGNRYLAMRHGESEIQLLKVNSSARDKYHLTPRGRKEVEAQARKLKKGKIELIVASPVLRTQESAGIVAEITGAQLTTDVRIAELATGEFEDKPGARYDAYFANDLERFTKAPRGGETLGDVKRRMTAFVKEIEKKYKGKKILLISHADPIWLLWSAAQGLTAEQTINAHPKWGDFLPTAAVVEIPWKNLPRDETGGVNLHRPFVDDFTLLCEKCKSGMRRVPEVADVWFDSGAMPFAQHHYPFAFAKKQETRNKKQALPYPADYICEAIDQTRGWFYTLHAVSTALGRGNSFQNVISLGHVLDKNGQKMSKSKGNVVDPWEMIEKYGTDTIRWYFYTVNAPGDPKRFDEKDLLLKLRGTLSTFWNSFVFFDTYVGKIQDLRFAAGGKPRQGQEIRNSQNVLDRWVMLRLDALTTEVTARLEAYDVVGAARMLDEFIIEDFSNWYLRRSRRRFQKPESTREKDEAAMTTARALVRLSELTAPFMPFLSEVVYQELKRKLGLKEESVHLRPWPKVKFKTQNAKFKMLLDGMTEVRRLAALALAERAEAGIKVRQPLARLKVKSSNFKERELLDLLRDEVNVKEIIKDPKATAEVELDTRLTPVLVEEGLAREIVRNIQEMRRDGGFKPSERVRLRAKGDERVMEVMNRWDVFIRKEAGVTKIQFGGAGSAKVEREVKLADGTALLAIEKT